MKDMEFIKDENGRIIEAKRGDKHAVITWADNGTADIDYVNTVLMIMFSQRDVGGDVGG